MNKRFYSIGALLGASFFWALGSMYSRRASLPGSPLLAVGMQMLVGGALLILTSGLCGEWSRFHLTQVSTRSLFGLGYLVLFGSIIAYNAYIWLLKAWNRAHSHRRDGGQRSSRSDPIGPSPGTRGRKPEQGRTALRSP
jgi:hypothetical protein